jgi:redox-sensitive bicupin YhaK (pirin superfamily)
MNMIVRRAEDRGHADHGWLDSHHTFSFADYFDPAHMGFGPLRVINDDRVAGGAGFPAHAHRDMEIVSYVLEGALEHRDTLGFHAVIRPGDVQRMTAGTGVRHSEYNASDRDPVHFLQIWIIPEEQSLKPGYAQKTFSDAEKRDQLRLVASHDGRDGSIVVHRDVDIYATLLSPGAMVAHELRDSRGAWIHVARGALKLNGESLKAGDGAALTGVGRLDAIGEDQAEVLIFDMAM